MRRPLLAACLLLSACGKPAAPLPAPVAFDPLAQAQAAGKQVSNREAVVPPQCYTKTDGVANPCWTCHVPAHGRNGMDDAHLQQEYAFSAVGAVNHWSNLFRDRRAQIAAIPDAEILAWIGQDNYAALRGQLRARDNYLGWRPDLDLAAGFDGQGFANDGSGWRAIRYQPFPGTFWPTNGSSDDVFIRLPAPFRQDAAGRESRAAYRLNLAILEAAMTVDARVADAALRRRVEPVDEALAGADLDGNGRVGGSITQIRGLPARYAGGAAAVPAARHLYPLGTEFLHTLRYVDPDAADARSPRLKELRYSVKRLWLEDQALQHVYDEENAEKAAGALPYFPGDAMTGLINPFGWQLQGFIEDARGRLRLQTYEEQLYCMGCHTTIGVTADQSFAFPRKLPGAAGWAEHSIAGLKDRPQAGTREPEALRYFRRVGGGDEFRANDEILRRYFPGGTLDEATVRRDGADLGVLLRPSRERALALNKAYLLTVREQSFAQGRDAVLVPAVNVHRRIDNGDTGLKEKGRVFEDGRLWVEWE
ncbi:hypothetical protein D0B54_01565 [Solimonas sp. K1W22B-7]|uniref:hypothetical protein n=1 Tax=Solimonas sp. K1W22B-7 TaxID=2303331 RepID=UPI000E32EFB0|nr:hypothetical protein [Solimonas sp. K1W22B-7]AXQ27449.1 hypothetical protein D0B54_01565 [Solimonas sp. K1W22B-7]